MGEGRTPEQVEVLAVAWREQGRPKMVARGGGKSSRWLPPQTPEPGGNVEMNCCCFSGSKFGGERGVVGSATEIRMRFLVLEGCAEVNLVTGWGCRRPPQQASAAPLWQS